MKCGSMLPPAEGGGTVEGRISGAPWGRGCQKEGAVAFAPPAHSQLHRTRITTKTVNGIASLSTFGCLSSSFPGHTL